MRSTLLLAPLVAALAACSPSNDSTADTGAAQPNAAPATAPLTPAPTDPAAGVETAMATATAALAPTAGNDVRGNLRFEASNGGIRVAGEVTGLPGNGEHGFHVHENGDCSAPDATSAGDHFNPTSQPHGRVGQGEHHAGDSENIRANADGVATVDHMLEGATLGDGAPTDIVGKAVIVHANPDDYTSQPSGNAGARVACGVIEAAR